MNWKCYNPRFEYEAKFQDTGWPWAGHKNFAYDLIRNANPEMVVELGTHKGTSFFSFCQATKDGKLKTKLYAVDTWKGDEHAGFYEDSVFEGVKDIQNSYYRDLVIHFLRKTFDEAVVDFKNKSIDLLHIDGLHTYEAVKHDFENWNPKVKDDGVVIFHDVFINRDDFGVYKLWEELKKKYKTIEFYHSFGLGVLFKDEKKYDDFVNDEKYLQMRYSSLSEEIKNGEINNGFNIIQQKDQTIQQKDSDLQQKDQTIQQKDSDLQQKDQTIQQKDSDLQQKDSDLQQKDQAIQQKENIIEDKGAEIRLMKSSKFWKAREFYVGMKDKLMGKTKKMSK